MANPKPSTKRPVGRPRKPRPTPVVDPTPAPGEPETTTTSGATPTPSGPPPAIASPGDDAKASHRTTLDELGLDEQTDDTAGADAKGEPILQDSVPDGLTVLILRGVVRFPFQQWARISGDPSKDLPTEDASELARGLAYIIHKHAPRGLQSSTPEIAFALRLGEEVGSRLLSDAIRSGEPHV